MTLMVVANMAFSGLLVSWVMKFADSIMKVNCGLSVICCEFAGHVENGRLTKAGVSSRCMRHLWPCL